MKKLIVIFILFPAFCQSQYFRDNFLGSYQCIAKETGPGGATYVADVLYISISLTDSNNIMISDSLNWLAFEYILDSDSTYENIWSPNIIYGHFYDIDSIYSYIQHNVPYTRQFWGKKITTGLNEYSNGFFSIYPNPAQNKIYINLSKPFEKLKVKLMDVAGHIILVKSFHANVTSIVFDLPKIANGIYFLNLESEKYNLTEKVFIRNE